MNVYVSGFFRSKADSPTQLCMLITQSPPPQRRGVTYKD